MGLSLKTKWFILILVTAMTVGSVPTRASLASGYGAEGESYQRDEIDASIQLPAVSIGSNSRIELRSATVMPAERGRTLFFTLTVINGESSSISFLDYWVKIYNRSGAEFKVELLPEDKLKKEIPAGQQIDYSFYAFVNESTVLEELLFRLTRWNYSGAQLEMQIGDIGFPETASNVMSPVTSSRMVQLGGVPVAMEATKWSAQINDSYTTPKLTLRLTNKGRVSYRLAGLQYSLRAENGSMYPLSSATNSTNGDKQLLQPDRPVEFQLKTEPLPASAGTGHWDVVITQLVSINSEAKINFPVTALRVAAQASEPFGVGSSVEYANENGVYAIRVEKLDRYPWEDQDILSTDISFSHQQTEALALPSIKAYYELDGGVRVDAKVIQTDRAVGVPPGGNIHLQLVGKVPYTYPFAATRLIVQEKTGESTSEEMGQFLLPPSSIQLAYVPLGQQQSINGAGRSTKYSPRALNTYTDGKSNLVEAQLEVVNGEKRSNIIPKLTAFFKTSDDALYPTKIREIKQKLNPQGRALISFTSKLPKDLDTKDLKLVVGESVTEQRLSGLDDKADAFIHAVEMELPRENTMVNRTLKDLSFYPYTLSIGQISTWLDTKQLRINYQYKLTKDSDYETSNEGSKVVVQFEDVYGTVKFEESFYLETAPDKEDRRLELGEHDYRMIRQDGDLVFKTFSLKQFKLNVYHEFQGKRKLLGSQTFDWFGTTD